MADKKLIQQLYDAFVSPIGTNGSYSGIRIVQANSTAPVTGQAKMTGSAVQLSSGSLLNGVILTAKSTNTGNIMIGGSGVTNTQDGTGNGVILEPGSSISLAVTDVSVLYAIGTTNDVLSYVGS